MTDPASGHAVGANLRRLRAERGLSLVRLASESGVPEASLVRYEEGGTDEPPLEALWALAVALDAPFAALVAGAPLAPEPEGRLAPVVPLAPSARRRP